MAEFTPGEIVKLLGEVYGGIETCVAQDRAFDLWFATEAEPAKDPPTEVTVTSMYGCNVEPEQLIKQLRSAADTLEEQVGKMREKAH